jgi:hypothetical protein
VAAAFLAGTLTAQYAGFPKVSIGLKKEMELWK